MHILFLTSGPQVPATRFRVLQWIPLLEHLGHRCVVAHAHPPKYESYRWLGWRLSQRWRRWSRRWDWQRARWRGAKFDVIFIERELFDDETSDMEELFRSIAPRLVLDVDDAIFLRHPQKFDRLTRLADLVIAGNDRLAERAMQTSQHVVVVPTCVDTEQLTPVPREPCATVTLGWIGTSSNLPYLMEIAPVLCEVQRESGVRLLVTVDASPQLDSLRSTGLEFEWRPWNAATERTDLASADIGLMPLSDTEWARYKCGFKLLQYMAVGRPVVASPVGTNSQIVESGRTGYLATTADEWRESLRRLIADPILRHTLGTAGRTRAEQHYSLKSHLPRLVESLAGPQGVSGRSL